MANVRKKITLMKKYDISSPKVSFFEQNMSISNNFQKILFPSSKRFERLIINSMFHETHDLENIFVADSDILGIKGSPNVPEAIFTPKK
jgi:hypothetical protein